MKYRKKLAWGSWEVEVAFDPWYEHQVAIAVELTFWNRWYEGFVRFQVWRTLFMILWWDGDWGEKQK